MLGRYQGQELRTRRGGGGRGPLVSPLLAVFRYHTPVLPCLSTVAILAFARLSLQGGPWAAIPCAPVAVLMPRLAGSLRPRRRRPRRPAAASASTPPRTRQAPADPPRVPGACSRE